jgi:hypothetical protein
VNRDEANAILALKNAWNGAIAATDRLRELQAAVAGLPEDAAVKDLDFETYHRASMAQANASMALRGVIEVLRERGEGQATGEQGSQG